MDRYADEIRELVELYAQVKKFVLRAEELDARLESNIAVIKEQRDALDHVMRFMGRFLRGDSEEDEERDRYVTLQIDKARGHLYRAGYDSLDGIIASVMIRIKEEYLKDVSLDSIRDVMPEYWTEYLPRLDEIKLKAGEHREQKDIGDSNGESFAAYQDLALNALEISVAIRDKRKALSEHGSQLKRKHRRELIIRVGVSIVSVVVGAIIGRLLF